MKEEMQRSKKLKIAGFDAPFFIQYHLRKKNIFTYEAEEGSLYQDADDSPEYEMRAEVRVGDYKTNSYGVAVSTKLPLDEEDEVGLKYQIWKITDAAYKNALENFLESQKKKVRKSHKRKVVDDFTKEKPNIKTKKPHNITIRRNYWKQLIEEYAKVLRESPAVTESYLKFTGIQEVNFIVNTEGTRLAFENRLFKIRAYVSGKAENGDKVERMKTYYATNESQMPHRTELNRDLPQLIKELEELKKAPLLKPTICPAIIDASNHSTFWHETVSHRLEGGRVNNEANVDQSKTFEGKIGENIAQKLSFINVYDDPTIKNYKGKYLIGSYEFDDQGVKAQRVALIEKGVLKNYLMSRSPVKGNETTFFTKSNGHGRIGEFEDEEGNPVVPIARNGNLIIESEKAYAPEELKKMLLKEIKSGNYEYGLILKENYEGSTDLKAADMIRPAFYYKIYPDGREELCRAKNLVVAGTPLNTLSNIIATDNVYKTEHGRCGAESGDVPVSFVAPAALLKKVELAEISPDELSYPTIEESKILPPPGKKSK